VKYPGYVSFAPVRLVRGHLRRRQGEPQQIRLQLQLSDWSAVSQARLSLTAGGLVRYRLKRPYSEGTTHVLFEPLDFLARLAALVPKPRVKLIRYHGVFAPNSAHRARVTKAGRGKGASAQAAPETDRNSRAERRASMTWAQRLKRVFGIDIQTCPACGGAPRIIACIEDPVVIEKILAHLDAKAAAAQAARPPPCRGPPESGSRGEPAGAAQVA
jgi:hypothetical protein